MHGCDTRCAMYIILNEIDTGTKRGKVAARSSCIFAMPASCWSSFFRLLNAHALPLCTHTYSLVYCVLIVLCPTNRMSTMHYLYAQAQANQKLTSKQDSRNNESNCRIGLIFRLDLKITNTLATMFTVRTGHIFPFNRSPRQKMINVRLANVWIK